MTGSSRLLNSTPEASIAGQTLPECLVGAVERNGKGLAQCEANAEALCLLES